MASTEELGERPTSSLGLPCLDAAGANLADRPCTTCGLVGGLPDEGICPYREVLAALRQSREDLNRAQAVSHTGSWRLDVQRDVLEWSDESYRIFEIPLGTPLTYEAFLAAVHPDDRDYVDARWQAAIKGAPYEIEHRIVAGRSIKWVRETAELEFDQNGNLRGGFGTVQDITERKVAREEIASLARFPAENPNPVLRLDESGQLLYANEPARSFLHLWGSRQSAPQFLRELAKESLRAGEIQHSEIAQAEEAWSIVSAPLVEANYVNLYLINVTERKRAEEATARSERLFRFLAEHAGDIIYLLGFVPEPHIEYMSPSCLAVTGYTSDDFLADPTLHQRLIHPDDRIIYDEFATQPESVSESSQVLRIVHKEGYPVWTEHHLVPVYDAQGNLTGAQGVARDITGRIRAEEEVERLRSEFMGTISHELKTPLTAIKGSAVTALGHRSQDPRMYIELLEIINEQSDRLHLLIDDLLDMASIESRQMTVTLKPMNVLTLARSSGHAFALSSGRPIDVQAPDALPAVNADERRVAQVLQNLLRNAELYSPAGTPIRVSLAADETFVTVRVQDEGRGIAPDQIPRLFKRFSRLKPEDDKGSGLGLAICKGIVESHGGRIWAESEGEGHGSTFAFTLPRVTVSLADAASAEDTATPSNRLRAKAVAVDDDPEILRYLRRLFGQHGHQCIPTSDPGEVPRIIADEEPDVILLDLRLPDASGFDILRAIREFSQVPIIFLTGSKRDEDLVEALRIGADDYLTKPFSPQELMARVDVAVRRSRSGASLAPKRYAVADLSIDFTARLVTVAGKDVQLTALEFSLLKLLAENAGRVITYDTILSEIWGGEYSGEREIIRSAIKGLRKKLSDDARNPRYIFNENRVGYRMERGDK